MKACDAEYDLLVERLRRGREGEWANKKIAALPKTPLGETVLPIAGPKKRGRPVGSKNKPKAGKKRP